MIMKMRTEHSFIKRVLPQCEASGWLLTESRYPPLFRMSSHQHENAYFGTVLQGSYSERSRSKSHVYDHSTPVLNPAGYVHSVHFHDAPTRIFRVELKSQTVSRVRQFSKVLDSLEELNTTSVFALMTRLYKEFLEPDDVTPLAIEGLILEVLAEASRSLSRSDVGSPPWLKRAQEFLHSNFAKPFCLDDVATAAGVHPVDLAREFRRRYRTTLGEYTRRLRVEAACRALSATDAPLSEIAASLGFSDQSHMGKHFKRLTGFTPAQYRANLKG